MTNEGELIAGRYRLVSQVGTGAMGVVWRARDERLQRIVAVKQLLLPAGTSEAEAEEANRRAMREGRITARLDHPHAITVFDVAEHENKPCLIMEYLCAESLSTVLATRGALPAEDVARIGSQLASALAAAHEAGIVHRDIKPGNVLLADDGTAKITDFGISRAAGDSTVTATGIVAGTPAYLAPEVAQGQEAGFPADVFSLGSTLYTAVEGVPPFGLDDNFLALLHRIATSETTAPKQSGPLTQVLTRILERDPSRRPTMRQVHEVLAAVAGLPLSPARPVRITTGPSPQTTPTRQTAPSSRTEPPSQVTLPAQALPTPMKSSPTSDVADPGPPTPVPDPVVPGPGPGSAVEPSPADRHRRRLVVATAGIVTVAAVVVGVVLLANPDDDASRTAGPASGPPSTTVQDASTSAPVPPPPPPPVVNTPTVTAPSPLTNPPTTATAAPDTPEQLQAAVSDYYALMPTNLQEGWRRLTTDYQTNHAGGFSGYQTFWDSIGQVDIRDVSATSPTAVTATISYFFKDGRITTEETTFGLVAEDGQWKIGSSTVITSRTASS